MFHHELNDLGSFKNHFCFVLHLKYLNLFILRLQNASRWVVFLDVCDLSLYCLDGSAWTNPKFKLSSFMRRASSLCRAGEVKRWVVSSSRCSVLIIQSSSLQLTLSPEEERTSDWMEIKLESRRARSVPEDHRFRNTGQILGGPSGGLSSKQVGVRFMTGSLDWWRCLTSWAGPWRPADQQSL